MAAPKRSLAARISSNLVAFALASAYAAVLFVPSAALAVSNPTVTGPIGTAGLHGHALWDSWFELADIGYTEEEYFLSGTAKSAPMGGTTAPFTTRIIVTRPIDSADFNGAVVFDWVNVTAQFENAVDTVTVHELLQREGYAYVHVSAQSAGICCTPLTPKIWDPIRYAALSHPGDTYAFDIFSQVVQALKFPAPEFGPDPMGGLDVKVALAAGQSQSASRLDTYVRQWQPTEAVIDGFLIHGGGSKAYSPPPTAPVLHLLSDFEAATAEPTTDVNYRLWEIAGSAHSDFYIGYHQVIGQGPRTAAGAAKQPASADADLHVVAGNYGEQIHPLQATCTVAGATMPMRYAASAAMHHLNAWVRTGVKPPEGPRYQFSGGQLARDQYQNALGGIRLPPVDVPVARYLSTVCALGGKTIPFTDAELALLYPTHADYTCQVQEKTDAAVAAGYMLPEDAVDLMTRVAAATNRWLIDGVPGCDTSCGDGVVEGDESCDDANAASGDGCVLCAIETCYTCVGAPSVCLPNVGAACDDANACTSGDACSLSAVCAGTPSTGAPCDDGSLCTGADACDANGNCVGGGPLAGCASPEVSGRASIKLVDKAASHNDRDALVWRWSRGTATKAQFADPPGSTGYALCLFDADDRLLMSSAVASGARWSETTRGFKYSDASASSDGVRQVVLSEGDGRARITVKGKGANLEMTSLGETLALPITVQLTNGATCWQAIYGNDVRTNSSEQLKARAN